MREIKLKIVPEPVDGTRSVLGREPCETTVIFDGTGNVNYVCGCCGVKLVEHVHYFQLTNLVIYCRACGYYNETPK